MLLIPFAEGVLLALLLREVHARHPLPLVEPGYFNAWLPPKPTAEVPEVPAKAVVDDVADNEKATENVAENTDTPTDKAEENASLHSGVSVFDGSENVSKNLPVNDALNAMMAEVSETVPHNLESRIEESTRLKDGLPQEMRHIKDDLDLDDLEDLAAALPKSKIDFSQELETAPEAHEAISPMAKELLGENFDFNALTQQAKQTSESLARANDANVKEQPVAGEPVAVAPAVVEPVATEPTVAEAVAVEPAATEPMAMEPTVAEPVAAEPVVTEPAVTEPATAEPVVAEPAAAKSATVEPAATEPATAEPAVAAEPTVAAPATTEPVVAEPAPAEPVAAEPATATPVATEQVPPEPIAVEPVVTEPTVAEPAVVEEPAKDSVEVMLNIQEDNAGMIQVSSPFLCADAPQLADFASPQMVLPMFSDDWIQVIEPVETDAAHFSFTEELQPMFVRKKKVN